MHPPLRIGQLPVFPRPRAAPVETLEAEVRPHLLHRHHHRRRLRHHQRLP